MDQEEPICFNILFTTPGFLCEDQYLGFDATGLDQEINHPSQTDLYNKNPQRSPSTPSRIMVIGLTKEAKVRSSKSLVEEAIENVE